MVWLDRYLLVSGIRANGTFIFGIVPSSQQRGEKALGVYYISHLKGVRDMAQWEGAWSACTIP